LAYLKDCSGYVAHSKALKPSATFERKAGSSFIDSIIVSLLKKFELFKCQVNIYLRNAAFCRIDTNSITFSDVIKKETGRPPMDHIHEFIINKAKSQLVGTTNSIGEIAYHLGFNSPNYFTRLFKSKTGLSPLKYRK